MGAGPAGYFAAQALQNLQTEELQFSIDAIERLPTPWGLVRSGVAPDHPKIKTVSKVFEKIATAGNFRLFGNVELGTDLTLGQLQEKYDAVVIATGGLSIPTMGASPFAYKMAEQFGLTVWPTRAGLVPFTLHQEDKEKLSVLPGISVESTVSVNRVQFRENILFFDLLKGPWPKTSINC